MPDYQSRVPQILDNILQQTTLSRNEICCKLRDVITELGGGTSTTIVLPGIKKLTGTASFTTSTPLLGGTQYRSLSVVVISLSTGTVIVTDGVGTTDISHPGFATSWEINKSSDTNIGTITISTTGDAVAYVTYTIV